MAWAPDIVQGIAALAAKNVDLAKNYGSDVLGIPGTNGPSPLQGGYPNFVISGFSSLGNG